MSESTPAPDEQTPQTDATENPEAGARRSAEQVARFADEERAEEAVETGND